MTHVTHKMPDGQPQFNRRSPVANSPRPIKQYHNRGDSREVRTILIVEDEILIAADLEAQIRENNDGAVRLASSIEAAQDELQRARDLAGVILDINIAGNTTFALADVLTQAGVPFVFFTGYRSIVVPDRFLGVPRIAKPATWGDLRKALATAQQRVRETGLGSFRDSVEAALPTLRSRARKMAKTPEDADRLVERTLERAISAVGNRSLRLTIEDWLLSLLEQSSSEGGRMLH